MTDFGKGWNKGSLFDFLGDKVLVALCCVAIAIKILLSMFSISSDEFLYLLKFLIDGWTKTPVPWVWISGPFYQMWLALPIEHPSLVTWIGGMSEVPGQTVYVLALFTKLPILIADLVCAFLVKQIACELGDRRSGLLAATLWLLNPYVLLTGDMNGSVELIPVAFLLASLFFLVRRQTSVGSVLLGISVSLKFFPVLITPTLLVYYWRTKGVREVLKVAVSVGVGFAIYLYWISSWGMSFGNTLLFYTPFTTTVSELVVAPYASKIGLATISALIFTFVLYVYWAVEERSLFEVMLGLLLAYMAFSDWWPQYLLWLIPLVIVDLVTSRRRVGTYMVLLLTSAFFLGLINFNFATQTSVFFIPVFNQALKPIAVALAGIGNDPVMILVVSPILRSIFAGVALFYSGEICVKNSPRLKMLFNQKEN